MYDTHGNSTTFPENFGNNTRPQFTPAGGKYYQAELGMFPRGSTQSPPECPLAPGKWEQIVRRVGFRFSELLESVHYCLWISHFWEETGQELDQLKGRDTMFVIFRFSFFFFFFSSNFENCYRLRSESIFLIWICEISRRRPCWDQNSALWINIIGNYIRDGR